MRPVAPRAVGAPPNLWAPGPALINLKLLAQVPAAAPERASGRIGAGVCLVAVAAVAVHAVLEWRWMAATVAAGSPAGLHADPHPSTHAATSATPSLTAIADLPPSSTGAATDASAAPAELRALQRQWQQRARLAHAWSAEPAPLVAPGATLHQALARLPSGMGLRELHWHAGAGLRVTGQVHDIGQLGQLASAWGQVNAFAATGVSLVQLLPANSAPPGADVGRRVIQASDLMFTPAAAGTQAAASRTGTAGMVFTLASPGLAQEPAP